MRQASAGTTHRCGPDARAPGLESGTPGRTTLRRPPSPKGTSCRRSGCARKPGAVLPRSGRRCRQVVPAGAGDARAYLLCRTVAAELAGLSEQDTDDLLSQLALNQLVEPAGVA